METIQLLKQQIADSVDYTDSVTDDALIALIEDAVFRYSKERFLTVQQKRQWVTRLFHSFRGLDVLQPLLEDPSVTEIMVNSHDELFVERAGEVVRYPAAFESRQKLEDIIQAIVAKVNRVVNEASPIVDARLQDGSRVNVVLPPAALKGPTMTIRKFPEKVMSMDDLIAKGALTQEAGQFLSCLVRAKYNIFIGGGTGSGKTTFLNALSQYIPEDERIITIEDSAELQIRTVPNLVSLETRNANTEGKGELTIRDLIRASLRMRPDRIIVGEVRGAEALDMLQAMNTGHDGSLSTGHANSTKDMLSRLETMVLSGAHLPVEVIRKQICSAIDVLVHLSRMRDRSRKVTEISEIAGVRDGEMITNPLFIFEEDEDSTEVELRGSLKPTGNRLQRVDKLKSAGIRLPDICLGKTE
jgi:pilus assembly protein CpaF